MIVGRPYTNWNSVPVLLSPEQAAVLLQMTPEHIRRMCRLGQIPAIHVGKIWRIDREVIRAMIYNPRSACAE